MPAGLTVEVIAKVPSRYYRVPRYFFTVLPVALNRWYRPTLQPGALRARAAWNGLAVTAVAVMLSLKPGSGGMTFHASDLDPDPMTFIYELDPQDVPADQK